MLYLGRLHPLKGLEMLVDAWGSLRPGGGGRETGDGRRETGDGWRLVIAGPDEQGMLRRLRAEADRLGVGGSIDFAGPVYGEEKERLLAEADLFVLPSRSENFGIVVAEALAAGVPVITTKGTPWEVLSRPHSGRNEESKRGAGWWVDAGVEPLAGALREAMALSDEERRAMGEDGRRLVEADYRWEAVAKRMAEAYERILKGEPTARGAGKSECAK